MLLSLFGAGRARLMAALSIASCLAASPVRLHAQAPADDQDPPSIQGDASQSFWVDEFSRAGASGDEDSNDHWRPDPPATSVLTVPYWTGSYRYRGITYRYSMVGTDPRRGSATTLVPTVVIPLRFAFADGSVFDAQNDLIDGATSVQAILQSPIFQPTHFVTGGVDVGFTQYGDAFQRANFWNEVSHEARGYHVLLGAPVVTPVQTINVPNGKFKYLTDPDTQQIFPVVDGTFIGGQLRTLLNTLPLDPKSLPIFDTGRVAEYLGWGFHGFLSNGTALQTFIATSYQHHDAVYFGQRVPDLYVLSHEVVEWLDDPFGTSSVPGWNFVNYPQAQCASAASGSLLEVADPLQYDDEGIVSIANGATQFHVTDAAFVDFFTRAERSRSVNGQYSFFATITAPTPPCVGELKVTYTALAFPGAIRTLALGINNPGQIVGEYRDASNRTHGFLFDHGGYTSLDVPGGLLTTARKINDRGQAAGYFVDSAGRTHAFLYQDNSYLTIDVPGAIRTFGEGINDAGDVVGGYVDALGLSHSFAYRNGTFETFDSPFASQSQAQAINDRGAIAGLASNTPAKGPIVTFVRTRRGYADASVPDSFVSQPYSINNHGDLAGVFLNTNGWSNGFVTIGGDFYQIHLSVYGNNDRNQIVGAVSQQGGVVGFVTDLPNHRGDDDHEDDSDDRDRPRSSHDD